MEKHSDKLRSIIIQKESPASRNAELFTSTFSSERSAEPTSPTRPSLSWIFWSIVVYSLMIIGAWSLGFSLRPVIEKVLTGRW